MTGHYIVFEAKCRAVLKEYKVPEPGVDEVLLESDYGAVGSHTVDLGVIRDRYESRLLEVTGMIRGEIENPDTCEHDLLVQEVLLAASGYWSWD